MSAAEAPAIQSPLAPQLRNAWQAEVCRPQGSAGIQSLLEVFRREGPDPQRTAQGEDRQSDALWASVLASRVAFISPHETVAVYDEMAASWLDGALLRFDGSPVGETTLSRLSESGSFPTGLLDSFWGLVQEGVRAETITPRIAAFGATYPTSHRDRLARAMDSHAGYAEFTEQPEMPRTKLSDIEACAEGTLGHALYRLIVDNGFDIEVLDPESVKGYHEALDPVNRRILQTHEIWHLVARYTTSPLHEVAISGFQLAQFGHSYSRDFLGTVLTLSALTTPAVTPILLQFTLEGWRHGRNTRPLLPVDWTACWNEPMDRLREKLGIETFRSALPDIPTP